MITIVRELKSSPLFSLLFAAGMLLSFTACEMTESADPSTEVGFRSSHNAAKPGDRLLTEIAVDSGFTELIAAMNYVDMALGLDTGLVELFSTDTVQYTIFAPTNDAFDSLYTKLGVAGITDLPADTVLQVLLYHVTNGRRIAKSVVPKKQLKTIQTLLLKKFYVDPEAEITAIGSTAKIIEPDITAINGIIHVVDNVLVPLE